MRGLDMESCTSFSHYWSRKLAFYRALWKKLYTSLVNKKSELKDFILRRSEQRLRAEVWSGAGLIVDAGGHQKERSALQMRRALLWAPLTDGCHPSLRKEEPPAAYRTPTADPFLFASHPPGLLLMMRSSFGRQFPHSPCYILLRCLICRGWDPLPSWKYKTPKGGGISRPTHNPQTKWDTEGG